MSEPTTSLPKELVEDLGDLLNQSSIAPAASNLTPPVDPNSPIPPSMTSNISSGSDKTPLPHAFSSIEGLFPGQPAVAIDPTKAPVPSTFPADVKPGDTVDLSKIVRSKDKGAKVSPVYSNIKCEVLDISQSAGASRYSEILQKIANSNGKMIMYEKEAAPQFIPNPKSPIGCNVIVVMKYCSVELVVERDPNAQFTQVSPEKK